MTFFMRLSSNRDTMVLMDFLLGGGVDMIEIFLIPFSAKFRLLGIGVADILRMSVFDFIAFSFSLSITQNLCSSSMIMRPRFLKVTALQRSLWVQITQ